MDADTWAAMSDEERVTYWHSMWKNTVLSNTYEPGSTFKAITAAIALEENLVRMDDHFFCSGLIYVKGVPLHCWKFPGSHGDQTFIEAFVNSCNPSFVEIGQRIGESTFYEYIEKFGFTETTGIDLPSEANSITLPLDRVGPIELATLSYGHGINVTMLQMTRVISALVNGGTLMKPQLVKEIYDEEGNLLQSFEPIFEERIISEDTSEKMRVLFEAAVQTGGGRNAYIEGISVGGKSGTTKKVVGSEYEDNVVISSFVGIAPMENPEFVILVTIDEPKNEVQGSTVVAPVVKSILEDILRYKNIIPDVKAKGQVSVPDLKGKTLAEAIKSLAALDLRYSTEPMNIEDETVVIIDQFPKFGTEVEKNAIIILSVEE
jgi:stage V sporulation protein D (sporulation-specific penicillin-binding protein)